MAVFKRLTKNGKTDAYYYEFYLAGKRYRGVCKECYKKDDASEFEKKIREKAAGLAQQKSVTALVENFKRDLSGGEPIKITDALWVYLKKPRSIPMNQKRKLSYISYWNDFESFLKDKFPDVCLMDQVLLKHAEGYIAYLQETGRYVKEIAYSRNGTKKTTRKAGGKLSSRTVNDYICVIKSVFEALKEDAGILKNPFGGIKKMKVEHETREAFSEEELIAIREKATPFLKPIFTIAFSTALREGDICTLKWSNIDFDKKVIRLSMRKTGKTVTVPIMPPLLGFLRTLYAQKDESPYVLPDQAEMYLKNPSGVSYRVKDFLEGIGIRTTRKVEGRKREVSVKDLHSCRHTFCYFAGLYGIPLTIVQSIVGHMSPEMTAHYSAHATTEAQREKMQLMPDIFNMGGGDDCRAILHKIADRIPDALAKRWAERLKRFI